MSVRQLAVMVMALTGAVALALSNPTTDDYLRFVESELGKALDRMDQKTPTKEQQFIRQVFRAQSKKILDSVVRPHTVRRNWGVMSLYETDTMDTQVVVLGLAGRFVPIKGVEEATLRIGRLAF